MQYCLAREDVVQYCLARQDVVQYPLARKMCNTALQAKMLFNTALQGRCAILPCKGRCCSILPCKEGVQYSLAREDVIQYCLARKCAILPCKEEAQQDGKYCKANSTSHRHQSPLHVQTPCVLLLLQYRYGAMSRDYGSSAALVQPSTYAQFHACRTGSDGSAGTILYRRRLRKVWLSSGPSL